MSGPRRRYGLMTQQWGWQPLAWQQNGLTSWSCRKAPRGLLTRRQMRSEGLAPGGAWLVGQLVFRHRRREVRALLYDRDELVPKRVPSAAQLAALGRALAARRRCPDCGRDVGYCIPTSLGCCVDCAYPDLTHPEQPHPTESGAAIDAVVGDAAA